MSNIQLLFLFSLTLIGFSTSNAQTSVDTLMLGFKQALTPKEQVDAARELVKYYQDTQQADSARVYSRWIIEFGQELQSDSIIGQGYGLLMLVDAYSVGENYKLYADSAFYHLYRADLIHTAAKVHGNLSYQLARYGDCSGGIRQMQIADSLTQLFNEDNRRKIVVRIQYCGVLRQCGFYDRVPSLAKELIPLSKQEGLTRHLAMLYDFIMTTSGEIGEPDSALKYVDAYQELLPALNSNGSYLNFYTNAGRVYASMENYEKAYELHKIGQQLRLKDPSTALGSLASGRYNLGQVAIELGRFQEAKENLLESLNYYESINYELMIQGSCLELAEAYAGLGNYKEAYTYWQRGDLIRDSLDVVEQEERIDELTIQFETQRIERELTESQLENQKVKARSRIYLGVFGVSALLVAMAFYMARNRRRRKELEYDVQQSELRYNLLRAQMNPHFIFNSLNSIQNFFSTQRFEKGNDFLGIFSQLVRRVLEQTGQKLITLSEELETLSMYLELEALRLNGHLKFSINLGPSIESEIMRIPPLLFQPFVENAIWHGIAPNGGEGNIDIYIDYEEEQDVLICRIEDDGVGIQLDKKGPANHRSRGVAITRERLGKGGKIDITDQATFGKTGVRTELVIPLWD